MGKIGLDLPRSGKAHSLTDAIEAVEYVGLPVIIRPAFTLGGSSEGYCSQQDR